MRSIVRTVPVLSAGVADELTQTAHELRICSLLSRYEAILAVHCTNALHIDIDRIGSCSIVMFCCAVQDSVELALEKIHCLFVAGRFRFYQVLQGSQIWQRNYTSQARDEPSLGDNTGV